MFRHPHTLIGEDIKTCKMVVNQKDRPVVGCDGQPLENVFQSKYLGSLFTVDGRQIHDIKVRITMAFARCDKVLHVLDVTPPISLSH